MGVRWDVATCVDCGEQRRVGHREWMRARQPRCNGCGGRVEASAAAAKEHVAHGDAVRNRRDDMDKKMGR